MNDGEVKEAFEAAKMQMFTCSARVGAHAKALVTEESIIEPVARFAASQDREVVSEAVPQPIVTASPSLPPSPNGSSWTDNY